MFRFIHRVFSAYFTTAGRERRREAKQYEQFVKEASKLVVLILPVKDSKIDANTVVLTVKSNSILTKAEAQEVLNQSRKNPDGSLASLGNTAEFRSEMIKRITKHNEEF